MTQGSNDVERLRRERDQAQASGDTAKVTELNEKISQAERGEQGGQAR